MVNWHGVLHTSGVIVTKLTGLAVAVSETVPKPVKGIRIPLERQTKNLHDIEVNSTRIKDTVDSLNYLRSIRARMRMDLRKSKDDSLKHKIFKINCEIRDLNTRLGNLKDEKRSYDKDEN